MQTPTYFPLEATLQCITSEGNSLSLVLPGKLMVGRQSFHFWARSIFRVISLLVSARVFHPMEPIIFQLCGICYICMYIHIIYNWISQVNKWNVWCIPLYFTKHGCLPTPPPWWFLPQQIPSLLWLPSRVCDSMAFQLWEKLIPVS